MDLIKYRSFSDLNYYQKKLLNKMVFRIKDDNIVFVNKFELKIIYNSIVKLLNAIDKDGLSIIQSLVIMNDRSYKIIYHIEIIYCLLKELANYDLITKYNSNEELMKAFNDLKKYKDCYIDLMICLSYIK